MNSVAEQSGIRLVVSDLDGTLLEPDESVTAGAVNIRAALLEAGIDFTVATGRVVSSALPIVEQLGITLPFIASNGATIAQGPDVLTTHLMPSTGLQTLITQAELRGLSVVYTYEGIEYPTSATPWVRGQQTRHRRYLTERAWPQGTGPDAMIEKVMIMDDVRDGRISWAEEAARGLGDPYGVTRYVDKAIEIVAAGRTKGSALADLIKMTGHTYAETLVIGDHENDLDMFKVAGLRAAVGNAIPAIKDAADYVSTKTHGAGAAEAIEALLGIRLGARP